MPPLVSHRRACGAPTSLHTRQIAVDATFLRLPTGDIHLLSACNAPDECAEEAVRPAGGGPPSPVLSPSWRVARRSVNCPDSTQSFSYSFFPPVPHSLTLYSGTMDRLVNVTKQQTARGKVSSQFSRKSCGCADPVPTLGTPSARGRGHRPAAAQEALRSDPTHNLGMGLCLEICRTLACALATFR